MFYNEKLFIKIMKNFTKRNQIILLNVIFMLLWMLGMYDDYKTKGLWMWENRDSIESEGNFMVFVMVTIIFISCALSILYQVLDEYPRTILQRSIFLRKLLKVASILFACSCIFMGGTLVVAVIRNVSNNSTFKLYDLWLSILSVYFGYLAYLILSQIRFSRKKKLVSEQILDEEIE
jgi:hypothetical protein